MVSDNSIVGLDLGTTTICVVIAEPGPDGIQILGFGHSRSDGLRRGVVVDVDKVVHSVKRAVSQAELMAGLKVSTVYAGVAGEHIQSLDSRGSVVTADGNLEISEEDRTRVIDAARTVAIPFDREVLHALPQEFTVDHQSGIRDPVGMTGVRLETSVHIVTGAVTSVQNICKSVQRADIGVTDIILEPLASGRAVLRDEEKEMGVCVVDIGGGTTDLAIYLDGSVRRTSVIGVGGQNVTNDIAICLRTSWPLAEDLKHRHGAVLLHDVSEGDAVVELQGVAGRRSSPVPRVELAGIVEARMEEIFDLVRQEIDRSGFSECLGAGIVLTGGGALIEGIGELAERSFQLPVRLGMPIGIGGGLSERVATPSFATALGLVLLASDDVPLTRHERYDNGLSQGGFEAVASRMKNWVTTFL